MRVQKKLEVVLLHERGSQPDEDLAQFVEAELSRQSFDVFVDRHSSMGLDWARELEARTRSADAIVPILSASSIHNETLSFQVESAHEAAQIQQGRPQLQPIRLNYTGPLPE